MDNKKIYPRQIEIIKEKFLSYLDDVTLSSNRQKNISHIRRSYGSNLAQLQWGNDAIKEVAKQIKQHIPNISEKRVENSVSKLMVRMFENQMVTHDADPDTPAEIPNLRAVLDINNLDVELQKLISSLSNDVIEQIVLVPIEGLKFEIQKKTVGDVIFMRNDRNGELWNAIKDIEDSLGREQISNREALENVGCFAIVKCIGDDDYARQYALNKVVEVINVFNFYLSSSVRLSTYANISPSNIIINRSVSDIHTKQDTVGFLEKHSVKWPTKVGKKQENFFENSQFQKIQETFKHQKSDEISQKTKRSIIWYGKAVDANTTEEKFVCLATALESLLIGEERDDKFTTYGSITQILGERVAFLLGKDLEERIELQKSTRRLYRLRSKVVHSGKEISENDLLEMDQLVYTVILTFTMKEFQNWEDFRKWITEMRFIGST